MKVSEIQNPSRSFWKFLSRLLQIHGRSLVLLLIGVILPLVLFATIVVGLGQNGDRLPWDEPILWHLHQSATPQLDHLAKTLTQWGGFKGSLFTGGLSLLLLLRQKRWRSLIYLLVTLSGTGLINYAAKAVFHRIRPSLWESLTPQHDFSFPSGHAMASMALVAALIILSRGHRWFWPIALTGSSFVIAIAWTRLYLGVHYPSDILAGWLVSLAWAIGVSVLFNLIPSQPEAVSEVTLMQNEVNSNKSDHFSS
uniref:Phosphoesterase PA-phosphatase related n=1 Tax=Cyanothece sp. (strain PCC 7425 / ATCC 29141) TaxID=395961 RepID=B8HKV5_CYAP4